MKKIIAMLAISALAVSAQSAQINWGASTMYNGAQQMSTANGYTTQAYLVYLGTAGSTWLSSGFVPAASFTMGGDILSGPKTANVIGAFTATASPWLFTFGVTTVGDEAAIMTEDVSTFGIYFVSTGGAFGTTAHYFLGDAFVVDTQDVTNPGAWTVGTSTWTYNQAIPSGSTWTPVPEPATAALALAGLAMLIRRRK